MLAPPLRESSLIAGAMTCVCCNCQREKAANGEWHDRRPRAGERVTHGICPHCLYELYPDVAPQIIPRPAEPVLT